MLLVCHLGHLEPRRLLVFLPDNRTVLLYTTHTVKSYHADTTI